MSKKDKLRKKLRKNPADASMQDVETLLQRFGFSLARVSGSHHIYEYDQDGITKQIVVPLHGNKVKKVYVKKLVAIIDELFPEDTENKEDEIEEIDDESDS
jgi:predicted RNA binding protein YcfA (HicA-like mRNA interferase family)